MAQCLVSAVRALGRLPALRFHHTLPGIYPWGRHSQPSGRAEGPCLRVGWVRGSSPARGGQEENEQQSPSCTLRVLEFAKGLKEAGGGP